MQLSFQFFPLVLAMHIYNWVQAIKTYTAGNFEPMSKTCSYFAAFVSQQDACLYVHKGVCSFNDVVAVASAHRALAVLDERLLHTGPKLSLQRKLNSSKLEIHKYLHESLHIIWGIQYERRIQCLAKIFQYRKVIFYSNQQQLFNHWKCVDH